MDVRAIHTPPLTIGMPAQQQRRDTPVRADAATGGRTGFMYASSSSLCSLPKSSSFSKGCSPVPGPASRDIRSIPAEERAPGVHQAPSLIGGFEQ